MESLLSLDEAAFLAINNGLGSPSLDAVMQSFSDLVEGLPLAAILLCSAFIGPRFGLRARIVFLAGGVLAGALVVHGIKFVVARPRPIPTFADRVAAGELTMRVVGAPPRGNTSFPSGHSQAAFSAAIVLAELYGGLRWTLLGVASLVALARVYLGAHFPLDVLCGALLGVASGLGAVALRRRALRQSASR
jgi:undecaprenyl-diphosphatase